MSDFGKINQSRELLTKLSEALGITYPVRRICIDVSMTAAPVVTVESYPRGETGKKLASVLTEEFTLCANNEVRDLLNEVPCRSNGTR
jgi:DUF917 family protein